MRIKGILILIITIILLTFSGFFEYFQYSNIENIQNKDADDMLSKITMELKKGSIKDSTIKSLKTNFFFVIWLKEKNKEWIPIVYDKDYFKNTSVNPKNIQQNLLLFSRIYTKTIDVFEFTLWINKFNPETYIKNIFIPFMFLILIYLFLLLIINLIFPSKQNLSYEKEYSNNDDTIIEENEEESFINLKDQDQYDYTQTSGKNKILDDYKELWIKNFKISDDFKDFFPFSRIYNTLKFGIVPESYIHESLLIATEYFEWKNPKIYLNKSGTFVDPVSKDILSEDYDKIPLKGNKKGQILIPVFSFKSINVFGYLFFEWDKEEDFYIADILYFLKYMFSDDAKSLFLDYKKHQYILDIIKTKLERKDSEIFVAVISPDNREKLKIELNQQLRETLNKEISNQLFSDFKKHYIFQINNFYYGIIGEKFEKSNEIDYFEKWVSNEEKHNYKLSNQFGNLALSFSCGISFRNSRDISANLLINEAENYLMIARDKGGNQVVAG